MKKIIGFILVINTSLALAAEWNCRNNEMEVTCSSEKCELAEAGTFTPMSVSFTDKGKMEVCYYTGCWEGVGKVFSNKNHMIISGYALKLSSGTGGMALGAEFLIALDTKDNVSLIKINGYAMPMPCEKILKK